MTPEKFGRYEVRGLVGEGSMGRVYRAFDPLAQRVVAIKTLKSEYLASEGGEEYLKRFRREAQAAGALGHPHIITVFDVGDDYFVMELLEGATLQAILRERGRLEPADALRILAPVADALDFAHRRGTIHRDIKPGNIMVLPDGRPRLMDFGVAHLTATVMTAAGQFLGSPAYMAPEQIMRSEASPRTDLFSLAVVAYEALTGRKPFEGDTITTIIYRVVNEDPPPPRHWNTGLPTRYDGIFARALAKDPGRRYATAGAFIAALEMREIESTLEPVVLPSAEEPAPRTGEATMTVDLPAEEAARTHMADPGTIGPPRAARPWLTALAATALVSLLGLALMRASGPAGLSTPRGSELQVETQPPAADVLLDGRTVGRSPLVLEGVAAGPHTVRVARDGYAPAELSLEVAPDQEFPPLRFVLQPASARMRLRSEPAGARVSVDGKSAGASPLEEVSLAPGAHEIRVEHVGYRPWSRWVEAGVGETVDLEARLEPAGAPAAAGARHWLREGDLVEMTPDVTPPRRVEGEAAQYPEAAVKLRLHGAVAVEMIVTESGAIVDPRVTESAGEILDRAVLDAVRGWRFEPARKQGVKVRVRYQYRQRFQLGA